MKGNSKRFLGSLQIQTALRAPRSVGSSKQTGQSGWVTSSGFEEVRLAGLVAARLQHLEPRTGEPTALDSLPLNHVPVFKIILWETSGWAQMGSGKLQREEDGVGTERRTARLCGRIHSRRVPAGASPAGRPGCALMPGPSRLRPPPHPTPFHPHNTPDYLPSTPWPPVQQAACRLFYAHNKYFRNTTGLKKKVIRTALKCCESIIDSTTFYMCNLVP